MYAKRQGEKERFCFYSLSYVLRIIYLILPIFSPNNSPHNSPNNYYPHRKEDKKCLTLFWWQYRNHCLGHHGRHNGRDMVHLDIGEQCLDLPSRTATRPKPIQRPGLLVSFAVLGAEDDVEKAINFPNL